MSATSDPIETPASLNIANLNTFYGGLPIEGPTEEDEAWMNAPMGTLIEAHRDPWPIASALLGILNALLLAAILLTK